MKRIYILLLLLTVSCLTYGQDYKIDLKKMNETYSQLTKFYTEISILTYETATSKTPNYTRNGIIRMDDNKFHYSFDDMSMLVNDKYSVMVQKETNTIIYKELKKIATKQTQEIAGMADLDKLMSNYKSVKYNGLKNGVKHYTIYPKYDFEKAELYMKPNGLITKIIYVYKNAEYTGAKKMVATFNKSTLNPSFSKEQFSEKKFFQKQGKEYVPVSKYKNYKLLKVSDYEG